MAKILFLDLETFPNLAWVWGHYEQNVIQHVQQKSIASFAAKWLDNKSTIVKGLPSYPGYKPNSLDDRKLVIELWDLWNEADVIVAHNGNDFDFKFCRARFLYHEMTPPSPCKFIDTKLVARKVANFNSNKLDDLGEQFGLGRKINTGGFELWEGCIKGDKKAWAKMLKYNLQDVILLEKIYKRLLPYINNHPNLTTNFRCPNCGSKKLQKRGTMRTTTRDYTRLHCQKCGKWCREVKSVGGAKVVGA